MFWVWADQLINSNILLFCYKIAHSFGGRPGHGVWEAWEYCVSSHLSVSIWARQWIWLHVALKIFLVFQLIFVNSGVLWTAVVKVILITLFRNPQEPRHISKNRTSQVDDSCFFTVMNRKNCCGLTIYVVLKQLASKIFLRRHYVVCDNG